MKVTARYSLAAALAGVILLAACGDDDAADDTSRPTATETAAATATPTVADDPTPTPTQAADDEENTPAPTAEPAATRQPAEDVATGPGHTIYQANGGESLDDVAEWFSGHGEAGLEAAGLASVNGMDEAAALEAGERLAVPVRPSDSTSIFAWNTLQQYIDGAELDGRLVVLHPSTSLVDGFLGRIALAEVNIDDGDGDADAPRGYVFWFSFTDRPAFRAGTPDEEANYTEPAFTLTAGSRANDILEMDGDEVGLFTRDGVSYGVLTHEGADLTPNEIWEQLEAPAVD